jgi:glutathione S-transferase
VLLYDSSVSGNCYKMRLLFAHLGLRYERKEVDVIERAGRLELLGELNQGLRVPTLGLDDGRSLGESNAIIWLFSHASPSSPRTSQSTHEAGHVSNLLTQPVTCG